MDKTTKALFLNDLPSELRLKIYELVLSDCSPQKLTVPTSSIRQPYDPTLRLKYIEPQPSMIRSSRWLRADALSSYYQLAPFEICVFDSSPARPFTTPFEIDLIETAAAAPFTPWLAAMAPSHVRALVRNPNITVRTISVFNCTRKRRRYQRHSFHAMDLSKEDLSHLISRETSAAVLKRGLQRWRFTFEALQNPPVVTLLSNHPLPVFKFEKDLTAFRQYGPYAESGFAVHGPITRKILAKSVEPKLLEIERSLSKDDCLDLPAFQTLVIS